ncbi:MAG: ATP-binding protein [Gemmatimonadota bacterium]
MPAPDPALNPPSTATQARVLRSGGEMGVLMRQFDWATTPLGPVELWPASLRTTVSTLLTTRHPMFLWWGPELIQFYNDGYRHSLGPDRHPTALGQRGRECWAEIWPVIGAEVDSIMAGGDATWHEDHLVPITRGTRVEDVYWSYSYSPVQDDEGGVGGVLVTVQETTQRFVAERRTRLVQELGDRELAADSTEAVAATAAAVLSASADAPFALVYLPDAESGDLRLAANGGLPTDSGAAPTEIAMTGRAGPWPLEEVLTEKHRVVVADLPRKIGEFQRDRWTMPVRDAVVLPLVCDDGARCDGVLVAGANPRLPLDEAYLGFFTTVAGVIATALAKVRAREQERRIEQQLGDALRLQSVGALAGGVAHEVNNQMTVVLGFGEFVLKALGPGHPQAADMRLVLNAGTRAAGVSQQLLTFTRQQVTQRQVLDLHALAGELEPVLRQLLGSDKTLTLTENRSARLINADPSQIEQVLINLVANSRDATPTGGRVTITVEDVELTEAATAGHGFAVVPGPYVLLTVTDSGEGMDERTLARVFEPFFTTKAVGQGSGLGLSMVYGIVKQHDGYIWAESALGSGTTMRLHWPAHSLRPVIQADATGVASGGPGAGSPGERDRIVWVVEDEPAVRALVARTLAEEGFRVIPAADGAEALGLLEGECEPPALVVTDLVMPWVNGRQVSIAVTARFPQVPVLFTSGYASDAAVVRGLLPESAAFLQKPFTPTQLMQVIVAMLAPL